MKGITALQRASQRCRPVSRPSWHIPSPVIQRQLHLRPVFPFPHWRPGQNTPVLNRVRCHSTNDSPARPLTNRSDAKEEAQKEAERAARKAQEPAYEMTFTCRKCLGRSSHRITKQAYHFGTTLITCPTCKNRHLISDHLKIFSDTSVTIEDILKEKGQYLRKGRLGADGAVEFYEDNKPT